MTPPAELPGAPTLSEAKRLLLERRLRGGVAAKAERILPRAAESTPPLSEEQHRIWLHAAMDPELPLYNEPITLIKSGELDRATLERSLSALVARHEILRTSLELQGAELVQVVHAPWAVELPLIDLSALEPAQQEAEASRLALAASAKPIDVTRAPLFGLQLLRFSGEEHRLQMVLHHAIFDGVAIQRVLLPELAALYAAYSTGTEPLLPEPEVQYGDYALWQRGRRGTAGLEKQFSFWRETLAGELPVLRLPWDRARPAVVSHRGRIEHLVFPEEVMTRARALAKANDASVFMVLLASLKALFFRYGQQEDVLVGSLADGRRRPELERMMGCFLETYVVRTRPTAKTAFADYLAEVREAALAAHEAAEAPFSQVVQMINPNRDGNQTPVIQAFLAFQPQAEQTAGGWRSRKTDVDLGVAKFELYIEVEERADDAVARLAYSTDLFDAETIRRLGGHWTTLLTGAVSDPGCMLGALPMLTRGEEEQLRGWNETSEPEPERRLHQWVAETAARRGEAVAVAFEGQTLRYAELERNARHLAGHLQAAGAGAGELVAVSLQRSLHLPSALLAVLRTGAGYLPLDPATPLARRQICIEDVSPAILLTQRSLAKELPATGAKVLFLEDLLETEPVKDARFETPGREAPAYVIHTSGSTGRPKAVEISHGAIANFLMSMQSVPGFSAEDHMLAVTTLSFDIAALEIFLPLVSGGRVTLVSRETAQDPVLLRAAIRQSGCTVLQATPATWRSLLDAGWTGEAKLRAFCGGEALTRELASRLLAAGVDLWNLYGPTETTVWSTVQHIAEMTGEISAGGPIANTTSYVLDAQQQMLPVGVPGELYLGGAGVANGYRNQPQLTAERFVSPAAAGGARLYRTGDAAVRRRDGSLLIQGRADNQVKVRGFRIELEEVEAMMGSHPQVAAAAARAWPDASGNSRLCGYVVARENAALDTSEFRRFLATRLPEYMVPSVVVRLTAMPLTQNGKLDRKALAAPEQMIQNEFSETTRTFSAPKSGTERRLAELWSEVLGVQTISAEDDFFDLGGHSLLVATLQRRVNAEFGLQISMSALFHAPTVARQAHLLESVGSSSLTTRILPLRLHGTKPRLFWMQPPPQIDRVVAGLAPDQPFVGVTITRGDLEVLGATPSMEALAAVYAEAILAYQPRGPYLLGGFCTGGILAYAVASALRERGLAVQALLLVDSENPKFYRRFGPMRKELSKVSFYARRAFRKGGTGSILEHLRFRTERLFDLYKPALTEMSAIENAVLSAAFRYQPPVYDGDVQLLLSNDHPSCVDYSSGWRPVVAGSLTCVEVRGHHDELLTAAVAPRISAALDECMRRVTQPMRIAV